jgi:hypothetical protein
MGSGPILGLGPAPSYTFAIYAAAVGSYFKVQGPVVSLYYFFIVVYLLFSILCHLLFFHTSRYRVQLLRLGHNQPTLCIHPEPFEP